MKTYKDDDADLNFWEQFVGIESLKIRLVTNLTTLQVKVEFFPQNRKKKWRKLFSNHNFFQI